MVSLTMPPNPKFTRGSLAPEPFCPCTNKNATPQPVYPLSTNPSIDFNTGWHQRYPGVQYQIIQLEGNAHALRPRPIIPTPKSGSPVNRWCRCIVLYDGAAPERRCRGRSLLLGRRPCRHCRHGINARPARRCRRRHALIEAVPPRHWLR
jgi:hypothetical protein